MTQLDAIFRCIKRRKAPNDFLDRDKGFLEVKTRSRL